MFTLKANFTTFLGKSRRVNLRLFYFIENPTITLIYETRKDVNYVIRVIKK